MYTKELFQVIDQGDNGIFVFTSSFFTSENVYLNDGMMINGKGPFYCAEQYIQYGKAMLFNDNDTALKILNISSTKNKIEISTESRTLGREVKNYNNLTWNNNAAKYFAYFFRKLFEFNRTKNLDEKIFDENQLSFFNANDDMLMIYEYDAPHGIAFYIQNHPNCMYLNKGHKYELKFEHSKYDPKIMNNYGKAFFNMTIEFINNKPEPDNPIIEIKNDDNKNKQVKNNAFMRFKDAMSVNNNNKMDIDNDNDIFNPFISNNANNANDIVNPFISNNSNNTNNTNNNNNNNKKLPKLQLNVIKSDVGILDKIKPICENNIPTILELSCSSSSSQNKNVMLLICLDVSGSMSGEIQNLINSLTMFMNSLKIGNGIGISIYSNDYKIILSPTEIVSLDQIAQLKIEVRNEIVSDSLTNFESGFESLALMVLASELDQKWKGNTSIIWMTDGECNSGAQPSINDDIEKKIKFYYNLMKSKFDNYKKDINQYPINCIGFTSDYNQPLIQGLASMFGGFACHYSQDNLQIMEQFLIEVFSIQSKTPINNCVISFDNNNKNVNVIAPSFSSVKSHNEENTKFKLLSPQLDESSFGLIYSKKDIDFNNNNVIISGKHNDNEIKGEIKIKIDNELFLTKVITAISANLVKEFQLKNAQQDKIYEQKIKYLIFLWNSYKHIINIDKFEKVKSLLEQNLKDAQIVIKDESEKYKMLNVIEHQSKSRSAVRGFSD
jgi:predicted NAD-dependent protein-ADP-ribosyltransferase YbiA (DUF1768 family)